MMTKVITRVLTIVTPLVLDLLLKYVDKWIKENRNNNEGEKIEDLELKVKELSGKTETMVKKLDIAKAEKLELEEALLRLRQARLEVSMNKATARNPSHTHHIDR